VSNPSLPIQHTTSGLNTLPRLRQFFPSHSSQEATYGKWYLSSHTTEMRNIGTVVHQLFEQVEWLPKDTSSWHSLLQPYQSSIPEETFLRLLKYIQQPDWAPLFTRPQADRCELWREKE